MTAARRRPRPSRVSAHTHDVHSRRLQPHSELRITTRRAGFPKPSAPPTRILYRRGGGARVGDKQQGFAVRRWLLALREQELDRVLRLQNGLRTQRRRKLR